MTYTSFDLSAEMSQARRRAMWVEQALHEQMLDGLSGTDRALEAAFLMLMAQGGRHRVVCPTEAARLVAPERWFSILPQAREAAIRLAQSGALRLLKDGRMIDPNAQIEAAFKVVYTIPPDLHPRQPMRDMTRTLEAIAPALFLQKAALKSP